MALKTLPTWPAITVNDEHATRANWPVAAIAAAALHDKTAYGAWTVETLLIRVDHVLFADTGNPVKSWLGPVHAVELGSVSRLSFELETGNHFQL